MIFFITLAENVKGHFMGVFSIGVGRIFAAKKVIFFLLVLSVSEVFNSRVWVYQ